MEKLFSLTNTSSKKQKMEELDLTLYFEYIPNFISNPTQIMNSLLNEIHLEQNKVKVFGREFNEPRLTAIFGDPSICSIPYKYSNSTRILKPFTKTLEILRQSVKEKTGIDFDFVLVNFYRDGNDKIGWHSDNESMMNTDNIISITFGTPRKFQIRETKTRKKVWENAMNSGSILWMKKGSQDLFQHQIPKESKITESRLNLTFRKFKEGLTEQKQEN